MTWKNQKHSSDYNFERHLFRENKARSRWLVFGLSPYLKIKQKLLDSWPNFEQKNEAYPLFLESQYLFRMYRYCWFFKCMEQFIFRTRLLTRIIKSINCFIKFIKEIIFRYFYHSKCYTCYMFWPLIFASVFEYKWEFYLGSYSG